MEDILIYIIVLVVGFVFGWIMREQYAMYIVSQMLKEIDDNQVEEVEERTKMRLERNGSFIYAFEADTDAFIGQATDLTALDKVISEKFPGRKFSVQEQNLIDIKADYHESV